jgi:thiosulfate/3-mercaptopyruvate sulfurtransferase
VTDPPNPLITPAELAGALSRPGLRIIDASWHLPSVGRDARAEHAAAHIPGAVFFDIDAVVDAATRLPHMLPPAEIFGDAVGALGIGNGDSVVVYDTLGLFSAPRAWWTFRAMGHQDVRVLDGGLPRWCAEAQPLESGTPAPAPARFTAQLQPELVRDLEQVRGALETGEAQLVDARPAPRFKGEAPEPRPGLRLGHMPGAVNAPFPSVLASDGIMLPPQALRRVFAQAGVDPERPIIASCGSGVTAAVVLLALHRLGVRDAALYDGSWAEWGAREDTPVVR